MAATVGDVRDDATRLRGIQVRRDRRRRPREQPCRRQRTEGCHGHAPLTDLAIPLVVLTRSQTMDG